MKNKITVYKETQSNWYPNYTLKGYNKMLVQINFGKLLTLSNSDNGFNYRVSIWGEDDYGLEKDFINRREAYECFTHIISMEYVNIQDLKNLGFTEV